MSWYPINEWQANTTTHALFFKHRGQPIVLKHDAPTGRWWFGDYDGEGSASWPYGVHQQAATSPISTHLDVCKIDGEAVLMHHDSDAGAWKWGKYDGEGGVDWFEPNWWQAKSTSHARFFLHKAAR